MYCPAEVASGCGTKYEGLIGLMTQQFNVLTTFSFSLFLVEDNQGVELLRLEHFRNSAKY